MADLALRFGKDMLVVSSPIQEALRRAGIESARDQALALLVEPETIEEAYRMETVAGPQCMVTPVADFTPARLVAVGAEGKGEALAEAALAVMAEFKPQHTLVEIAPCGLPLDPDSKASLVENRDQYARAAQLFDGRAFDAFFLNGFTTADDLKCALMGLRKVTDAPIIASVDVQGDGVLTSGRGTVPARRRSGDPGLHRCAGRHRCGPRCGTGPVRFSPRSRVAHEHPAIPRPLRLCVSASRGDVRLLRGGYRAFRGAR